MSGVLFGKLPTHGDFIARGVMADARETWDVDLSTSLAAARGDRFDDHYAMAPPWRFIRPDGEGWLAGAIALSMDSAGRRFPIVGAVRIADPALGGATAALCEAALFSALGGGWNADTLAGALSAITASDRADVDVGNGLWWVDGGSDIGIAPLSGPLPPTLISAMLAVVEMAG